jgi:uncharacterized protein (DUF849 family)
VSSDLPPVIIEAALNGGTSPQSNPNVPQSSEEITRDGLACLRAGAAVVHTHLAAYDVGPEEAAELYLEHYEPMLAEFPDALLYPTIVFNTDRIEERVGHLPILAARCGLRIGLMEPGSGSFVPTADDGLPTPRDSAYVNTPAEIRYMAELCEKHRLAPSMVIFEPGFLRHALVYERAGRLPQGVFMRLTLCGGASYRGPEHVDLLCGMPNTPAALDLYLDMLGQSAASWAVSVVSGDVFENGVARHALERGGHLRVGLEDYAGPDQPTNLALVERAAALAAEVGRPLARPDEAADLLDLPPRHDAREGRRP